MVDVKGTTGRAIACMLNRPDVPFEGLENDNKDDGRATFVTKSFHDPRTSAAYFYKYTVYTNGRVDCKRFSENGKCVGSDVFNVGTGNASGLLFLAGENRDSTNPMAKLDETAQRSVAQLLGIAGHELEGLENDDPDDGEATFVSMRYHDHMGNEYFYRYTVNRMGELTIRMFDGNFTQLGESQTLRISSDDASMALFIAGETPTP